jgi:hypothetical protein
MNTKHLLTRQIGIQNPFRRGNFGLSDESARLHDELRASEWA